MDRKKSVFYALGASTATGGAPVVVLSLLRWGYLGLGAVMCVLGVFAVLIYVFWVASE